MTIPVGVIGASGYIGGEMLRLLDGHPEFDVCYVSASERQRDAAATVARIHPHLRRAGPTQEMTVGVTDVAVAAGRCAAVFLCTPAEVSAELAPALLAAGVEVVVDLSPAFRIAHPAVHRRWYPGVARPAATEAVYGLPEAGRAGLAGARLIAVPGCLATAAVLGLLPLTELAEVTITHVQIDAKAASTGGGNSLRASALHPARSGVVSPYAPAGHRHAAEIRQALTSRCTAAVSAGLPVSMSAYAVDAVRGVSVAAYVAVKRHTGGHRKLPLTELYTEFYRDEQFVRVRDWASETVPLPDPKYTLGSNFCDVAAFHDGSADRLVVVSVLDNLVKGGAGQALQACNARYGLPEHLGLSALPLFPV
jgi:N-acetyl-gamma-glutamyl-phosphate/LysW-gamma-L-alpha-aminoadipyl-6-phosphate reductase